MYSYWFVTGAHGVVLVSASALSKDFIRHCGVLALTAA